jgi:Zn-dependent peptidase ImmA (M78 family)
LLAGDVAIDDQLADQLSSAFGSSTSFWRKRERLYREDIERLQLDEEVVLDERWARAFPVADMRRFGWLPKDTRRSNVLDTMRRFFDIETTSAWKERYRTTVAVAAFRTSPTYQSNPAAVAAWLRWAEIQGANINCRPWNADELLRLLPEMRKLTVRNHPSRFVAPLRDLCAEAGIALVIAPAPKGCRASGATRFISDEKAMVVLSLRYRSDDHFWFTFFHEVGHLLLHGKDALFLEDDSEVGGEEEVEANAFAERVLIPEDFQHELATLQLRTQSILRFSVRIGTSSGVVVGQLQHAGRLHRSQMNHLKRRYDWRDFEQSSL